MIAGDGRPPAARSDVAAPVPPAVDGAALFAAIRVLGRHAAAHAEALAELRRAIDSLRGAMTAGSGVPSQPLIDVQRSVEHLETNLRAEVAESGTLDRRHLDTIQASVESLRTELAETALRDRQGVVAVHSSIESLRTEVRETGAQERKRIDALQASVESLPEKLAETGTLDVIQTAVDSLRTDLVEAILDDHQRGDALRTAVDSLRTDLAAAATEERQRDDSLHGNVESLRAGMAGFSATILNQMESLRALVTAAGTAMVAATEEASQNLERLTATIEALADEGGTQGTKDLMTEVEGLVRGGLPQFSQELRDAVQQSLVELGRTFDSAEREHGDRMTELHRAFEASARRIEATLESRRREINRRGDPPPPWRRPSE